MSKRIPILTSGLMVVIFVMHYLVLTKEALYFSAQQVLAGEYWRLLSGHLVHADTSHLLWNGLGLLALGVIIEHHSRLAWWVAFIAGLVSVNVLLLSPFSELQYYCGLSGVLNTLLLVAIWLQWRASRSWWLPAFFVACVVKVIIEVTSGESVISNISWPPYAWAHAAGLLGGLSAMLYLSFESG